MPYPRQRSAESEIARDARAVDRAWSTLQDHLLDLRKAVQDEIRTYPTPIAGCDQQFNYLLEKRERIAAELSGVNQALARGDVALATEIVRSSEHIHQDIKASFTDARVG
jgi:hypothetical protein